MRRPKAAIHAFRGTRHLGPKNAANGDLQGSFPDHCAAFTSFAGSRFFSVRQKNSNQRIFLLVTNLKYAQMTAIDANARASGR